MLKIIRSLSNTSKIFDSEQHSFLKHFDIEMSKSIDMDEYPIFIEISNIFYDTPLSIWFNIVDGLLFLNYYNRKDNSRHLIQFKDKIENYTDEELILSYGRNILDENLIDFESFEEDNNLILDTLLKFIEG